MHFDETLFKLVDTNNVLRGFSALQFKLFCNEEKFHFFNFNTFSRISLCAMGHYLRYVEGKH